MKKVAIFVHATENELGRAVHALVYADEIHSAGGEVKVIFDGQGTQWIPRLEDESHPMNPLFKKVKGLGVIEACESCAGIFNHSKSKYFISERQRRSRKYCRPNQRRISNYYAIIQRIWTIYQWGFLSPLIILFIMGGL